LRGGEEALRRRREKPVVHQVDQPGVEDDAAGRGDEASLTVEDHRRGDDGNEVEEREGGIEPAGEVHQHGDDEDVAGELDVVVHRDVLDQPDHGDVGDGEGVADAGNQIEVID